MGNLGVKHEVAYEIVLADERGRILTEIMEYFHDHVGLHDLLEAVAERINGLQVNDEALVGKENLNELHAPVFGQAFAVHAEDRRVRQFVRGEAGERLMELAHGLSG